LDQKFFDLRHRQMVGWSLWHPVRVDRAVRDDCDPFAHRPQVGREMKGDDLG